MSEPLRLGFEIVEKAKDTPHLKSATPAPFEQEDPELGRWILQPLEAWLITAPDSNKRRRLVSVFNQVSQITKDSSTVLQVGRNDPCSCGSGKKFKKCCLKVQW